MVGDMDLDDDTYVQILRQNIKDCDEMHVRLVEMEKRAGEIEAAHEEARRASREALAYIRDSGAASPPHGVIGECSSDFELEVKSISDDDQRILAGVATAPTVDRHGDIVDPLGATYEREIPLLLNHDSTQVVGIARLGKATSGGIPFEASIAKIVAPGTLQDRCNEAWLSVKNRLIKHVSIGFRALDLDRLDGGGLHHKAVEILELSLVPVPAQPQAQITAFKAAAPTAPPKVPRRKDLKLRWAGLDSDEDAVAHLHARLGDMLKEFEAFKVKIDESVGREPDSQHAVTLTQAQYSVLRELPGAAAACAFNQAVVVMRKALQGAYAEIDARLDNIEYVLGAHRKNLGNLNRKIKTREDADDE